MKPKENPRPSPIAAGTSSVALLGLLAALALALSFLEGLLPALPVPGAKLGLSNIVTMYALTALSLPAALGITAVKAVFALLRGGSAFLMSAAGGLLSTLVMALCLRLFRGKMGDIGIGIAGAVAHGPAADRAGRARLCPLAAAHGSRHRYGDGADAASPAAGHRETAPAALEL